jgi:cytochrome c oxidase cbb3-type subunit IV
MRYLFNGLEGVELFGIISLLIFSLFFFGVILWAFKADNKFIEKMKNLPLEENSSLNQKETKK